MEKLTLDTLAKAAYEFCNQESGVYKKEQIKNI